MLTICKTNYIEIETSGTKLADGVLIVVYCCILEKAEG